MYFFLLQLTVKYHDGLLVPVNENTKEVVVIKKNGYVNATQTYHKFELNENGTIAINIPTSTKEEAFSLKVRRIISYPFYVHEMCKLTNYRFNPHRLNLMMKNSILAFFMFKRKQNGPTLESKS